MGRRIEKEPMGLPIQFSEPFGNELVVNTPLVLKSFGATSFDGKLYENTRHTITRTPGDENGDNISVTTAYLNPIGFPGLKKGTIATERFVLKDKQRAHTNLPGRGVIYLRIPR